MDPLDEIRRYLAFDPEQILGEQLVEVEISFEEGDAVGFVASDLYGDEIAWAVIGLSVLEGLVEPVDFFETDVIQTLEESLWRGGRTVYLLEEAI